MTSTVTDCVSIVELERIARRLRRDIIQMIYSANSGHPGGSLSAVEILTALYFGGILRHDPQNSDWPSRDRFILSKGHAVPVLYAALAERGYFPLEELSTLRQVNSRLQGHPVLGTAPGIEASTGSLGQGLSMGIGMALAARMNEMDYHTYVLMGDGECQEGQIWEAAMAGPNYDLERLTAIVDSNRFQLDGPVEDIQSLAPLADKWSAFGWNVIEVDGHEMAAVLGALQTARDHRGEPTCIIAHTVKGKGVTFMENNNEFHGKAPSREQFEMAMAQLED
ncbi:MAG: transketolase [Gemmatimonadota bacterium]|nr:transketolase [Gemmatimonadota bacterium]